MSREFAEVRPRGGGRTKEAQALVERAERDGQVVEAVRPRRGPALLNRAVPGWHRNP